MKSFKNPRGPVQTVTKRGTVEDAAEVMQEIIHHAVNNDPFLRELAEDIKRHPAPLAKVFQLAYVCSKYREDRPEHQIVQAPAALINNGFGNCVDYSVFISSLLTLLNIPHSIRLVNFKPNEQYGHVYIVAEDGTVLDPIYGKQLQGTETYKYEFFDQEVPHYSGKNYRIL